MNKSNSELMQVLLNSCDDVCYVKDNNGIYLYVNLAFCQRAEKEEGDILGQNDFFVFPEIAADLIENDQRVMASREAETVEESGIVNGTYFCYKSSKTPLIDESGQVYGLSGVAFNYTETKLLENEKSELLAELKKSNDTLNHLFSVIAHDLKEPFNSLMTTSQLLLESHASIDKSDSQAMLVDINSAAKSTYFLMNNLLAWSLQQMNNIKPDVRSISLNEVIETCLSPYHAFMEQKSVQSNVRAPANTYIKVDEQAIHIVLTNLIHNAIKFSQTGGLVEIIVTKKSTECHIAIKDNGIGISKVALNKIFDIKKSTLGTGNEKGTGIGLNLCKQLIEQSGGRIVITSELDIGTTAQLILRL